MKKSKHSYFPLVQFSVMLILGGGGLLGVGATDNDVAASYLSVLIYMLMAFAIPTGFFLKMQRADYTRRLRLRLFGVEKIAFVLIAAFFMIFSLTSVKLILQAFTSYSPDASLITGVALPAYGGVSDMLYAVLVFALVPAIVEELLFRGLMLVEYEASGVAAAVILSSLAGAMVHFVPGDFLIWLIGGLILALTVYLTGSIFGAMIVHFLYNLFAVTLEPEVWIFVNKPDSVAFFVFIAVGLTLLTGIFLAGNAERIFYTRGMTKTPAPVRTTARSLRSSLLSPFMLVCYAAYILLVVICN